MKKILIKAVASMALILGASYAAHAAIDIDQIKLQSAVLLPKARELKPFKLEVLMPDTDAKAADSSADKSKSAMKPATFTNENLKGHWTLMFFGFTHCPALCPTSMAQLNAAYKVLEKDNYQPLPQVVFVSVDPEADNLQKVTDFVKAFNPNFIGARSDDMKMLNQMTHQVFTMFEKVPENVKGKKTYTINHSGDIIIFNPKGEFVGSLRMPHTDKDIVADYKATVDGLK